MEGNNGHTASKLSVAEAAAMLAAGNPDVKRPVTIDPKQIILGLLAACSIMLFVLLTCVLIAYLSMAALTSF